MDVTELLERLEAHDTRLWTEGNVAADRLGWLDLPGRMAEEATELEAWARSVDAERVVVLGMGGSSLGPEVLRSAEQSERMVVCDTTDPATVAAVPLDDSFFVVSSKSGTTLEPNVLLAHAWDHVPDGSRYAAITDAGTPLDTLATERGFARVFRNPADIDGRYSVLSYFGLVPAALLGYDLAGLCDRASSVDRKAAVDLGVMMGEAARSGRDKVTIEVPPGPMASFGLWVEQLIASCTGKRGTGCVPVPTTEAEEGEDRFEVSVHLGDPTDLGAEFMRWEVATAIAGHVLDIDPFDQPNVTESEDNTTKVLDDLPLPPARTEPPGRMLTWVKAQFRPGDYVSLQAYLPYDGARAGRGAGFGAVERGPVERGPVERGPLDRLRRKVRNALGGAPVTAGYGPRFLHSTGQLHKGGPDSVIAVQIVPGRPSGDVKIPGHPFDFGTLLAAQAEGDHKSLKAHGRRVLRVAVDDIEDLL
jgi:transaldolase / glucose-6-phosphate isomerase